MYFILYKLCYTYIVNMYEQLLVYNNTPMVIICVELILKYDYKLLELSIYYLNNNLNIKWFVIL